MNPTWVYHPEMEAKIVSEAEANVLLREGWFDSPAKFNEEKNVPRRSQSGIVNRKKGRPPKLHPLEE